MRVVPAVHTAVLGVSDVDGVCSCPAVGHEGLSEEEDQEAKITSYEEALMKIKDATGVASIQEVVERFLSQGATRQHLDRLKEDNARQIERLREERVRIASWRPVRGGHSYVHTCRTVYECSLRR